MWSIVFLTNQKDYEPIDGAQKFLPGGLGRWACGGVAVGGWAVQIALRQCSPDYDIQGQAG